MFHWNHGWYFERLPDGSVHILKRETAQDGSPAIAEATIPPAEWASIVASVSQWGESGPIWSMLLGFHGDPK